MLHTAPATVELNEYGNPAVETDPLGNQTVYYRDSRMNVTRKEIWEEQGEPDLVLLYAEEKTYSASGHILTYTEAAGFPEERTTTYTYDAGLLASITVTSGVDSLQNKVTSFEYYDNDNLRTRTEQGLLGDGNPFSYVTTYTYNENGQMETIDGPRTDVDDITTYAYDDLQGNLSSVTQLLNLVTTYENYTVTGQPEVVTDPNGVPTTYTYDSLGRVTSSTIDGDTTS